MTLRPALDRLGRGFRRMWAWVVRRFEGARGYRFEGEQAAHADQLRETQISLSLMSTASTDPDHARMASEIEDGAENQLTVLLGKARLTLEEKRTRDAIQRALQQRRQGFAPVDAQPRIRGFLGPVAALGGVKLWMILAAGWALTGGFALVQMGLKERIEDQRDEARAVAAQNARAAAGWRERSEEYRQHLIDASSVARHAADALEAERARQARAAARERRRQREVQNVIAGAPEPPAWSLRDDGAEDRDSGPTP